MSEYSSLLGDAVLRHRTRIAEHSARVEAELASKVKSEFIANMSHELRTPLNTIIGFSKILCEHDRKPLETPDLLQYANLIHDAAGHLLAVINDILDISKIQSGRFTLDDQIIHIDEILTTCISSFKLMAKESDVTLAAHFDDDIPVINGDPTKLRQVFTNLIGNAIKFSKAGGTVDVEISASQDDCVCIYVRDSGVGMTDEEVRVALTPFGQVDGTKTRWREGTGLGLPIAKALVALHHGKLVITSAKNEGTEVCVRLPAGKSTQPQRML